MTNRCQYSTPCGDACISRAFSCLDHLGEAAQLIMGNLISVAKSHNTTHSLSLFEHTDSSGQTWFVKRFMSIEADAVKAELNAFQVADKMGISSLLVRPKMLPLPGGKTMLIWPKLPGQTLRNFLARGGRLSRAQQTVMDVAADFDKAIGNPDRNHGNVWVEPSGRIRLLDHDQAKL